MSVVQIIKAFDIMYIGALHNACNMSVLRILEKYVYFSEVKCAKIKIFK